MTKDKIREIIFGYRTKEGKLFDVVLLIIIILSVIAVMLDSSIILHDQYGALFFVLEWIFTILFT